MASRIRFLLTATVLLLFTPFVLATPFGQMTIANCSGGGIGITLTSIDFQMPAGPPNGCIVTGNTTNVTFSGGTLGSGVTGTVLDLSTAGSFPLANFITMSGLTFDLFSIGPGSANTICGGLALGASCSPVAGSPLVLTNLGTSTLLSFSASGDVYDATGTSHWNGVLTSANSSQSPLDLQNVLLAGGTLVSTHSDDFHISVPFPEPSSLVLLAVGLIGSVGAFRKLR